VIATKVHISKEARMRKSVSKSLASLGVKKVDLMQLHGLSSKEQVVRKDIQQTMRKMKQEGMFKYSAVTTHSNQIEVLEAVAEDGFYDAVLVAVNFRSPADLFEAIKQASDAGVGIIAMKTQNGGFDDDVWPDLTPHQAALRYVLEQPGIHLAVPGMLSRNMVNENLGAVARNKDLSDILHLENYQKDLLGKACSFCSGCIDQCRFGIGGMDVARIRMYFEGYRDRGLAVSKGREVIANLRLCNDCEGCSVDCSQAINIKESAQRVLRYLS
ncbi:MAG: aldo/keto reductase, partial [Desulfocapsaceae bacterium]